MAYPTVNAPYGFKPINEIGGLPYAGSTRKFAIAASYTTPIFYGDWVKIVAGGTIQRSALYDTADPSTVPGQIGIFLGCSYTNPTNGQTTYSQFWPGISGASNITAFVVDDPNTLFKAVLVAGDTADSTAALTPAYLGLTVIGSNAVIVQNTGNTTTGDSRIAVYTPGGAGTASLPIRIVDVVPDTANASGNFCELICKINMGYHSYTQAVGI